MKLFKSLALAVAISTTAMTMTGCAGSTVNGKTIFNSGNTVTPSGKIVSKTLNLQAFHSITLQGIQDVEITQGSKQKVVLTGSDNLIQYCSLKVKSNGDLDISLKKDNNNTNFRKFDVVVKITVPNLDKVVSNGTGDIKFTGNFKANDFSCTLNGTGDITLPGYSGGKFTGNLNGTGDLKIVGTGNTVKLSLNGTGDVTAKLSGLSSLTASLTGTGDLNVSGSTQSASYSCTGTGDIYARNMQAKDVTATATGTGDITCFASESFSGNRTSITHITCYGKPAKRDIRTEGYDFP